MELAQLDQPSLQTPVGAQIGVQLVGIGGVIIGELVAALINQVEHIDVEAALLERELARALTKIAGIALIPDEMAHYPILPEGWGSASWCALVALRA
jgi:hypothetical protein